MAIAASIIAIAHHLNLRVVAEGVETDAQLEFFRHNDCDEIQGFLLGSPRTAPMSGVLPAASACTALPCQIP